MNHGPLVFLGMFVAVVASWLIATVAPHFQFGNQEMVVIEDTGADYPAMRQGEARQGAEIYRNQGCVYCHTQQVRSRSEGADIARDWGKRRTVSRDYLRDEPPMLGQLRIGPDLANFGTRATNAPNPYTRIFLKLYDARIETPGSMMPRYLALFETRKVGTSGVVSPDALTLPERLAPPAGYEVVPRPEAYQLAQYLLSLHADVLFFEVFPPQAPRKATNAVEGAALTNGLPVTTGSNAAPSAAAGTNRPPAP